MQKWLTILDLKAYLKISKETIYRAIYSKKIPFYKVGTGYRFNAVEIDEWVTSRQSEVDNFFDTKVKKRRVYKKRKE